MKEDARSSEVCQMGAHRKAAHDPIKCPGEGRSALAAVPHQEQITGRKSTNSLGEMLTCKSKEGGAP